MLQLGIPFDLDAGDFVSVRCPAREGDTITWDVRAERSVAVYVLDSDNFAKFKNDEQWEWDAGHGKLKIHSGEYVVPDDDDWMVVVLNNGSDACPVVCEVWIERET